MLLFFLTHTVLAVASGPHYFSLQSQRMYRLLMLFQSPHFCLASTCHRHSILSILVETFYLSQILNAILTWSHFPQLSVSHFSTECQLHLANSLCSPVSRKVVESVSFLSSLLFKHRVSHQFRIFTIPASSGSPTCFTPTQSYLKFLTQINQACCRIFPV